MILYNRNRPIEICGNGPQTIVEQHVIGRRYTRAEQLLQLAKTIYQKEKRGIRYSDLIQHGLAKHKKQAQRTLKHGLKNNILFTLRKHRPQRYYPAAMESQIKNDELSTKNALEGVNGVTSSKSGFDSLKETVIMQSLEGYILPLLASSPIHIHKIQLKTKLTPETYNDLPISPYQENKAKKYTEIIGNKGVTYLFYPSGTVMIFVECTNNPFRLMSEEDRSRILTFFGQVRDRLIMIVADPHERFVSELLTWELIQCEINRDIRVSDWFQITGLRIQIRHLDHFFRIYIKSLEKDTVCRIEESLQPKKTAVQAISDIFNPVEKIETQLKSIKDTLDVLIDQRRQPLIGYRGGFQSEYQ